MKFVSHAPYLRVADMQRSLSFYRDGLGFKVRAESSGDAGLFWASLEKDGFALMICHGPLLTFAHSHEAAEHEHDEHRGHIFSGPGSVHDGELNLVTFVYVEDGDAVYAELKSRGREFLLRDQDGYYYAVAKLLTT